MKTVYEKLLENPDYAKYVSALGDEDRKYIESFAVNLSKYADEMLVTYFTKLGNPKVTESELSQAIRDRTGGE
jgi:hypothetical protein